MRQSISKSLRFKVFDRDWFRCCYCWATPDKWVKLEVDHIVPVSKWWTNDIENLSCACFSCNRWKSNDVLWSKHKQVNIEERTKELEEKYEQLKKYYDYIKRKKDIEDEMLSIDNFVELWWRLPWEEHHKDIKKCIKKYWIELTIEWWNIFCNWKVNTINYFWWICKTLHQKQNILSYDELIEFHDTYLSSLTKYMKWTKDFILTKEIDVLQTIVNTYGRQWSNWMILLRDKDAYKKEFWLSEYWYSKSLYKTIKDQYDIALDRMLTKNFNS